MKRISIAVILSIGLLIAIVFVVHASDPIRLYINGNEVISDVPAQIIDGRAMVPIRVVSESLGATVVWQSPNIMITTTNRSDEQNLQAVKNWVSRIQVTVGKTQNLSSSKGVYSNIGTLRVISNDLDSLIREAKSLKAPDAAEESFVRSIIFATQLKTGVDLAMRACEESQRGNNKEAAVLQEEAFRYMDNAIIMSKSENAGSATGGGGGGGH